MKLKFPGYVPGFEKMTVAGDAGHASNPEHLNEWSMCSRADGNGDFGIN